MRTIALLITIVLAEVHCSSPADEPAFIDRFDTKVDSLGCSLIPQLSSRGSAVADIATTSDSSFLALYPLERELVVYDHRFGVSHVLRFDAHGPRGVVSPISATNFGDSLFFVADEDARQIKRLTASGEDSGSIPLEFTPRRIRSAAGYLVVTPLIIAQRPPSLAYVIQVATVRSTKLPIARYGDVSISALANMASVATFPDGRTVIAHELVVPYGYSFSAVASTFSPERFPVPLPKAMKAHLDRLPATPISDESVRQLVPVALTMSGDPRTGDLYYLTSSGQRLRGRWGKSVMRLDSQLHFKQAYRLPMNGYHLTFLPARGSLIVVDDEDQWFECKIP